MKTEFDVIVVGAGINGITCGAYLQKAGLDVAVVERRNECGAFALTEEPFGAGIPLHSHAVMCLTEIGPACRDLELERFGFTDVLYSDVIWASTWKDGKNMFTYFDPGKTAQAIARFSEKDAQTYLRIMNRMFPDTIAIQELLLFSPPSAEKVDLLWEAGQKYADIPPSDFSTMNGFELYDLLFENEYVKLHFTALAGIGILGNFLAKGEGTVSGLFSLYLPFGVAKGSIHHLPHALVRCFKHYGGTLFLNAPVEKVVIENGTARGVILAEEAPYPQRELRARHAVVIHVTPPVALPMIGEENVKKASPELWRKMKDYSMSGASPCNSHYLLRGLPRWRSEEWNPDIKRAWLVYRAWDSWEHCQRYYLAYASEDLMKIIGDTGELFCPAVVDPSQFSPEGYCAFTFEAEYPFFLRRYGGPKRWDDPAFRNQIHEIHTQILEELAPGFKALILDSFVDSPLDIWRRNPSAVYGQEYGGDVGGDQWYLGKMPYRSPIPQLYFSNGVWPIAGTYLAGGYNAACVVAEDLGVRNRPWWTNKPMEHFLRKMQMI